MSTRKKPRKHFIQRLPRRIWRVFDTFTRAIVNGVLRSLMVFKRRSRSSQAGFVLPTVVMVLLVVVLLTTAIVIRSFDRAKNASNYRVNEAVLNAATPALDRARAKIERLFSPEETNLSGNTPPEGQSSADPGTISNVLSQPRYTFGDEKALRLVHEDGGDVQTLETAWKFPVDTDNDGKFDTFTLYGIYFRNPPDVNPNDGVPDRTRTPLEARALPQATGLVGDCAGAGASSASGGEGGWYETDGQLKKAFFIYVANVPISQADIATIPAADQPKYEAYIGNKGFSALEMQQDQARIALDNNAVWYDDDLSIAFVGTLRLNGRIHTNSNLMVANRLNNEPITLYQVSSLDSCFYTADNAQISVGGNVAANDIKNNTNKGSEAVRIHLYQGRTVRPDQNNEKFIDDGNQTTQLSPPELASNSNAYEKRLRVLTDEALALFDQQYPTGPVNAANVRGVTRFSNDVKEDFEGKFDADDPASGRSILTQVLRTYFANRIRRVAYKEVPFGADPLGGLTPPFLSGQIDPPSAWMLIDPQYSQISLKTNGVGTELEATAPNILNGIGTGSNREERNIGDRILVGNALPREWFKSAGNYAKPREEDFTMPGPWFNENGNGSAGGDRYRLSRTEQLDDLGDTSRGGFWEQAAAYSGNAAKNYEDLAGGLRIITNGGIYIDDNPLGANTGTGQRGIQSFLPPPPTVPELIKMSDNDLNGVKLPKEIIDNRNNPAGLANYRVVWPDTMPMFEWKDNIVNNQYDFPAPPATPEIRRGDLQMRATVVYHYADSRGPQQEPLACIASFYDPTSPDTAQNFTGLPQNPDLKTTTLGASVNGITYPATFADTGSRASAHTDPVMLRQANMIFPNGRWANEPLRKALIKLATSGQGLDALTLGDIAAIDSTRCALGILNNPTGFAANPYIDNFVIQERAFLDARQIKAIHKRNTDKAGNLLVRADGTPIDRRTLLEDINDPDKLKIAELGSLTTTSTTLPEYSLPIEQRQPLEIRVTEIDLERLKSKTIGGNTGGAGVTNTQEYMLPNSGIIYASRDDALQDISDTTFDPANPTQYGKENGSSATDFELDPTRRPNGIRLVNGSNLARVNTYRTAEKGLILASDLPVYIKADEAANGGGFNRHFQPGTTTLREEFIDTLDNNYSDFYTRDAGANGEGFNKGFACRPNPDNPNDRCENQGDQWRPARILSDAVTLLSSNFRDGYRYEGDYDLNNNVGNLAVEARLKKGFWWNSFATTTDWYGNNGYPKTDFEPFKPQDQTGSSYVMNAVTPVQRRVNFPQYMMEACTKRLVSDCSPQDWVAASDKTGATKVSASTVTDLTTIAALPNKAGTTSQLPTEDFLLSPRRVAFKRNPFGALDLDCTGSSCVAIPRGVDTNDTTVADYRYGNQPPPAKPNSLWYWTTSDATNANPSVGISYNNATQLYYLPPDPEAKSERQLLLPGLPEFPPELVGIQSLNSTPGVGSTNLESAPSDYAIFGVTTGLGCRISKDYRPTTAASPLGTCPADAAATMGSVGALWSTVLNYTQQIPNVVSIDATSLRDIVPAPPATPTAITLRANAKVNIINLPANGLLSGVNITLDRNNRSDDPLFLFRSPAGSPTIEFRDAVRVTLNGVEPNNIFWVPFQNMLIRVPDAGSPQHQLVGNFINGGNFQAVISDAAGTATFTGTLPAPIVMGRFLGFSAEYPIPDTVMTAMTTTAQPLLVPVLQLHSPQGIPANTPDAAFNSQTINADYWVQRVASGNGETYNGVFIMGDSPSRPGESGGGLGNFPRFLEAWEDGVGAGNDDTATKARNQIKGSFIQFKKSIFATAPFETVDDTSQDNSLFFDSVGGRPDYMANFPPAAGNPYIYKGGASGRRAPFYRAPERAWGYDVGLLSQTPDLFARRFSNPSPGDPNEYFREVGRDDRWIQTLMCAAQKGATGTTYDTWAVADPSQRPSVCQTPTPGANYN